MRAVTAPSGPSGRRTSWTASTQSGWSTPTPTHDTLCNIVVTFSYHWAVAARLIPPGARALVPRARVTDGPEAANPPDETSRDGEENVSDTGP
jgi:hypothetical protein